MRRSPKEPAQTGWDYLVLTALAFAFLFLVLYFSSDGRILDAVGRQLGAFGQFLSR